MQPDDLLRMTDVNTLTHDFVVAAQLGHPHIVFTPQELERYLQTYRIAIELVVGQQVAAQMVGDALDRAAEREAALSDRILDLEAAEAAQRAVVERTFGPGYEAILSERARQIAVEGWDAEHDDRENHDGQLALAARCYELPDAPPEPPEGWPWDAEWWRPREPWANLVRAGALWLAEADRLERAGDRIGAAVVREVEVPRCAKALAAIARVAPAADGAQ